MGLMSSIAAANAPQPVLKVVNGTPAPVLSVVPPTYAEIPNVAVRPAQPKDSSASVNRELSQSTAARMLVENANSVVLDNIPFTNDAAVLLDDIPMPEKLKAAPKLVEPEVKPETIPAETAETQQHTPAASPQALGHVAERGYHAGREASGKSHTDKYHSTEPRPETARSAELTPAPVRKDTHKTSFSSSS